ncbi:MAG: AlpA family phage regulatory protein [Rhodospirillales bacterium]|nr:AlpA family phage regulatory protein [Rhodospirillales bacterium]
MERLLRRREVQNLTTLSKTTLYAKMKTGEFPRPLSLGKQPVAWRASDVEAWIHAQPERAAVA